MDRRCVLNWLNEVYVTPSRAFNEYTDDELKMFAHDAIVLLKEQDAVKPILTPWIVNDDGEVTVYKMECGKCGVQFYYEDQKYCSECGTPILLEGR